MRGEKKSIFSSKKPREVSPPRGSSGVKPERPRSPRYSVGDLQKLTESERVKCTRKEGNATELPPLKGILLEVEFLTDGIYDTESALLSKDKV